MTSNFIFELSPYLLRASSVAGDNRHPINGCTTEREDVISDCGSDPPSHDQPLDDSMDTPSQDIETHDSSNVLHNHDLVNTHHLSNHHQMDESMDEPTRNLPPILPQGHGDQQPPVKSPRSPRSPLTSAAPTSLPLSGMVLPSSPAAMHFPSGINLVSHTGNSIQIFFNFLNSRLKSILH